MKMAWLALAATLTLGAPAIAQNPVVQLDFTSPRSNPPHWTLTLHPDGSGHFRSEGSRSPTRDGREMEAPNVDRDIQVSKTFAQHVFEVAQRQNLFNEECDSHLKVAFQGWKKLSYSGPKGTGSCTFNYSKNKEIETLGDSLLAVSQTILEGARLEMLLQHDPLGLDKEMQYLTEAVQEGQAQQVCTIRKILERLAKDDEVMDLVRKQARKLLERVGT